MGSLRYPAFLVNSVGNWAAWYLHFHIDESCDFLQTIPIQTQQNCACLRDIKEFREVLYPTFQLFHLAFDSKISRMQQCCKGIFACGVFDAEINVVPFNIVQHECHNFVVCIQNDGMHKRLFLRAVPLGVYVNSGPFGIVQKHFHYLKLPFCVPYIFVSVFFLAKKGLAKCIERVGKVDGGWSQSDQKNFDHFMIAPLDHYL